MKADPKYAALLAGVTTGLIKPEAAATVIAQDLEASGIDVRGPLARVQSILDVIRGKLDAKGAPAASGATKGPNPEIVVTVREVK